MARTTQVTKRTAPGKNQDTLQTHKKTPLRSKNASTDVDGTVRANDGAEENDRMDVESHPPAVAKQEPQSPSKLSVPLSLPAPSSFTPPVPLPAPSLTASQEAARQTKIDAYTKLKCIYAWPLCKHPQRGILNPHRERVTAKKNHSGFSGNGTEKKYTLLLPKSYRCEKIESERLPVWTGCDLNSVVYKWYQRRVSLPTTTTTETNGASLRSGATGSSADQKAQEKRDARISAEMLQFSTNYVTNDNVLQSRHEFLGPAPRVAGYRITPSDEIHILWYDGLVEERWCEREDGWKGEVYEANGEWKEQTEVD